MCVGGAELAKEPGDHGDPLPKKKAEERKPTLIARTGGARCPEKGVCRGESWTLSSAIQASCKEIRTTQRPRNWAEQLQGGSADLPTVSRNWGDEKPGSRPCRGDGPGRTVPTGRREGGWRQTSPHPGGDAAGAGNEGRARESGVNSGHGEQERGSCNPLTVQ